MYGSPTDPITVLLVDDDERLLQTAEDNLAVHSDRIETVTATAADAALERVGEGEIDCIVTDYNMPEMDGLAFLQAVRSDGAAGDVPVIFFTGEGTEAVASDAISAGVTDYLRKSGDPRVFEILARRVETYVDRRRQEAELDRATAELRQVYERVSDAVVGLNADLTVTYLNRQAEALFDVPSAAIEGRRLDERFDLDGSSFAAELAAAAGEDDPTSFEEPFPPLSARLAVAVYPGDDGVTLFVRDVTDRYEQDAEIESLREELDVSEGKFRTLRKRVERASPPFR